MAKTRTGPQDTAWVPYEYPWDDAPLDLSFLYAEEAPAGRHGFLAVEGDRFVFQDGTRAKFWGTCFNSAANFPTHEHAEKVARRLAKFGINMFRTHQLDAEWATPNIFQFTKGRLPHDTLTFDPESLDRLDYLIHCLKQKGIYVYLDLLCYRRFKAGDGVDAVDQLPKAAKPYSNFDPRMIGLQKKYAYDLCTHVNPYTSLAYRDDPAIALVSLANENDLMSQNVTLEPYRSRLEEQYRRWAERSGVEAGPGRVDFTERTAIITRFLHDVQAEFYREMIAYLRALGVRVPVTGNNMTYGLAVLSCLSNVDFTDCHPYWDMWSDTEGHNKMMLAEKQHPWPNNVCRQHLLDRPLFMSEWDSTWPNEWRAESPLTLAGIACLQGGGGALIHTYRYRCTPVDCMGGVIMDGVGYRVNFDTFNDPAKFGLFYHAALMVRRGDVARALKTVGVRLTEQMIYGERDRWHPVPAIWPAAEMHRLGLILPGQEPRVDVALEAEEALDAADGTAVRSDTGEIGRDWSRKMAWIDTPRTKAAYGMLGEQECVQLNGLWLEVKTPFAVIAISSLTDEPIERSDNLLLTAVGRADNTAAQYNETHTRRLEIGHAPILIERIDATIKLTTAEPHLTVRAIDPEGFHYGTVPSKYEQGVLTFELGQVFPSMYYLIQRISGVS